MKIALLFLLNFFFFAVHAQSDWQAKPNIDGTYRLVVAFASRASGPDAEGLKRIQELIKVYENKFNKKISYNIGRYGREGETDYSFDLNNLSKKQVKKFVAVLNKEMRKYNVVSVGENMIPMSEKFKRKG